MYKYLLKLYLIFGILSCSILIKAQLIKDPVMLDAIEKQLIVQKNLVKSLSPNMFGPFKPAINADEMQAMDFLYAFMPLSDLADYNRQFFLDNARMSLKSRAEMPWGKSIPEDVFLHFVLPLRVNNENLDSFRILMYEEIKNRIKGLSMKDAVLELNHWCHEKVTYKGSDERTSAPLSTMQYSFGRCGEESTFTVNTLRAAGIPARQVYTPRWAHTDDNHAWVEAWVDGTWYFMGACEPDPDLNMGWFAAPATRAMLMNTRAFGKYNGTEPRIEDEARFSELNLIANYAPSKKIYAKIIDEKGQNIENARVEFQLYNYAEFYPLTKTATDKNGLTSMITGFGDLLVWANHINQFGYKKITVENIDTVTITLKEGYKNSVVEEYDFVPPLEREINKVGQRGRAENDRRLQKEDSIRGVYMKTFKDTAWAADFARRIGTNTDSTVRYILSGYGNWAEIQLFLEKTKPAWRSEALRLLSVISAKDLRDTKAFILEDHLKVAMDYRNQYTNNQQIWEQYILSGRIANEMMVEWKEFLRSNLKINTSKKSEIPDLIKKWTEKNTKIDLLANAHSRAPLSPIGVFKLRVSDSKSRDIFFVAACRANGIASRLQPETLIPQVWDDGRWKDIIFVTSANEPAAKGYLNMVNMSSIDPKYFIHFTLACFTDGVYRSLQFPEEKPLSQFDKKIEVPAGNYMLVTGNRQQDGSVLCRLEFFEIKPGETKEIQVKVRDIQKTEKSWAQIQLNEFEVKEYKSNKTSKLSDFINNKPFVIAIIDPDKEPTKHVMADLKPIKGNIEKWGGSLVFLILPDKTSGIFNPEMFPGLPLQSLFLWDINNQFIEKISSLKSQTLTESLPVIIVGDAQGNLNYFSKGYKIGVGEQLVKFLTITSGSICK